MTKRDRFINVLNHKKPADRLPMIEWAHWWDKTHHRWQKEGLPPELTGEDLFDYFGLDRLECIYIYGRGSKAPGPAYHGAPIMTDQESYDKLRPFLYTDDLIEWAAEKAKALREIHERGETTIRIWFDGFFWFPRSLFGINDHLYAFYDYPELMHQINQDLTDFYLRAFPVIASIVTPDMIAIAEDMSYNNGPMLSEDMFNEFIAPYYAQILPMLKATGAKVFVDTDGDLAPMIPWLVNAGIDGIFPLERQANVDIVQIKNDFPNLLLMGGFDKMAMIKGEDAIRNEFERIFPVMQKGGYLPGTDHQVPPEVSLENYRIFIKLYKEYCEKACITTGQCPK